MTIHLKVLNLSSVSLTPSQIQILSKGLQFTPTSQRNLPKMEEDIKDFTRKLRLVESFSENPELDTPDSSQVKSKSNFCPRRNRNSTLESVIKFLQKQSFYEENFKDKSNISKHEWQDILNLKKNKDIVIKEADKGGAVVIMNIKHYFKMISDHLNDETTYKMVEANCHAKGMKGIANIIEKYKHNLTKMEKEYLTSFPLKSTNFYAHPKIHKSKLIQNAIKEQQKEYVHMIEPSDLKLRPIAAGPICPTRPLSNLIDILFKPFLLYVKTYVNDNLDFLSKYSRENYEDTLLVTFDVVSLYTNIPNTFGLESLDYWLENHLESLHARFNKEFVLKCAKFILQNNNPKFNNEFYNQIKGTAMGTYIKENWNRFLDDCYTVLRSSQISPEELLLTLNSISP